MNGRIYDPLLGRFLSADRLVDNLADLQSYNRFSYVGNHPLTLVDPSGFSAKEILAKEVAKVIESDGLKVAGRAMTNARFAGKEVTTAMLRESNKIDAKLLERVDRDYPGIKIPFDKAAVPDFSAYAIETFETPFKSSKGDIDLAWKSLEGAYAKAEIAQLEKTHVWHHRTDETLELIPSDIHDAFRRTGGDAMRRGGIFDRAKAAIASTVAALAASATANTRAAIQNEGFDVLNSGHLPQVLLADVANTLDPGVQVVTQQATKAANSAIDGTNLVRGMLDKPEIDKLPVVDLENYYETTLKDNYDNDLKGYLEKQRDQKPK
jgi:HNH/ENDO VII superfamily nuclease